MPKSVPAIRDFTRNVHFQRFVRNRSGETVEEIATSDRVTEKQVKKSIQIVEAYQAMTTAETVNHGLSELVLSALPDTQKALQDSLRATETVKDEQGKEQHIPDHMTRDRAVQRVTEIAKVIQPKVGPQVHVKTAIGIAGGTAVSTGPFVGMEDRMREIRSTIQSTPQLQGRVVKQAESVIAAEEGEYEEDDDESDSA